MAFDEKKLRSIKVKLEKEKVRLTQELKKMIDYPEYGTSEDDNVQEIEAFGQNISLRDKFRKALSETEQALKKIDQGTYGICDRCQKPIELKRLSAFPEAAHCLGCEKILAKKPWWRLWQRR